jgi:hypothetical protein
VIALDAKTGEPLWPDLQSADPKHNEAFSSAPIAAKARVFTGIVTSDAGIAGRLMAFDARTGAQEWSFDTTVNHNASGGFWTSYSLDSKTREVFAGIANPRPDFNRDINNTNDDEGDEKYTAKTNSVISINAMNIPSAELNWFYQAVPKDEHDRISLRRRRCTALVMGKICWPSPARVGACMASTGQPIRSSLTHLQPQCFTMTNPWMLIGSSSALALQDGALFSGTACHPGTGMLYVGMSDHCTYYIKNPAFGKELGGRLCLEGLERGGKTAGSPGLDHRYGW